MSSLSRSGNIKWWEYQLLDSDDVFKKNLNCVISHSQDFNSLSRIKSTSTINITDDEDINFLTDRIKIIRCIKTLQGVYRYPMGVFLLSSPQKTINYGVVSRSIQCCDKLQILDWKKTRKIEVIPAGTNVDNEIARWLGTYQYTIPDSGKVTNSDKAFDGGTPYLDIVNYLLDIINYTSLYADQNGFYAAQPYVLPIDRVVDVTYTDTENHALESVVVEELNTFGIYNVFVRYVELSDGTGMRYEYENTNDDSQFALQNFPYEITSYEQLNDIADTDTLEAKTLRDANEATQSYSHLTFSTMIIPLHWYMTTVFVQYDTSINDKYSETSWNISSSLEDKMEHNTRKVVAF
jgi:hypothetical protein